MLGTSVSIAQDAVIGTIGEHSITASAFRRLLDSRSAGVLQRPLLSAAQLDQLLRTELIRRALAAEARASGIEKRPDVAEYLDAAREQALVSAYVNEVARAARDYPSDAEIGAFYSANPGLFAEPARYHVAQIFLTAPAGDARKAEAARNKAEAIAHQARQRPEEFAQLAKTNSDHAETAATGGDLGWLAEEQILPEIRAALADATPNAVLGPVRSAQGWHILRLLELRSPSLRPLPDVRANVVAVLRYRKAQENERRHIEQLLARTPITVNEAELARFKDALGAVNE